MGLPKHTDCIHLGVCKYAKDQLCPGECGHFQSLGRDPEELAENHLKFLNEFSLMFIGKVLTPQNEFLFKHGIIHGHKHGREANPEE